MKLLLVLMLCSLAAAAPREQKHDVFQSGISYAELQTEDRNILLNALIRQVIAYVRSVINNGSVIFGIPPLDPLKLNNFELNIPAGLINLQLKLKDISMTGLGDFVTPVSSLNVNDFSFDIEVVFPKLDIQAGEYDLVGDLFNAIPLYGKGPARFVLEDFTIRAKIFLKQSEDGTSIVIDKIENASFIIPSFKSELQGAIGGGSIDAIVNAVVEEVVIDYVNRFQGAIAHVTSSVVVLLANPILNAMDTWKYIAPFIPRN